MNSTCIPGISLEKHVEFYKTSTLMLNIMMTLCKNKDQ